MNPYWKWITDFLKEKCWKCWEKLDIENKSDTIYLSHPVKYTCIKCEKYFLIEKHMKVKCIKDTIGFKKWQEYHVEVKDMFWNHFIYGELYLSPTSSDKLWITCNKYPEYFQEVKEESNNPRWKVWDPVVKDWIGCDNAYYYRIQEITKVWDNYRYDWFEKERLRDPTDEELKTYFR